MRARRLQSAMLVLDHVEVVACRGRTFDNDSVLLDECSTNSMAGGGRDATAARRRSDGAA